ncbi:MAG: hypothetical protein ABIR38_01490 [Chthoniobacterales bacterium]
MSEPEEAQSAAPPPADPDILAKMLEIELIAKRAAWERARANRGRWRALSLLFLLVVVLGGIAAWFYFATEMRERRNNPPSEQVEPDR